MFPERVGHDPKVGSEAASAEQTEYFSGARDKSDRSWAKHGTTENRKQPS